ncbi:MAG: ABC transporter permease [Lysobacteraceae bacterium]|nr:MAG: ABC transporter permease [Xanthomonadaceae bacterium]
MNALTSKSITSGSTLAWLVKREYWENRGGFLWAPIITGAIVSTLYAILAVIGSISASRSLNKDGFVINDAPDKIHGAIGAFGDGVLMGGLGLASIVLAFVVFFYALGSLYDDRRDRSILFWKSLPVSDLTMVLSKAAWALLLAPAIAIAVGAVISLVLWIISALTITVHGLPASSAIFTHSHPIRILLGAVSTLPVYVLWALPSVGWLMFCSAWARSKPFLWAVLLPVLACVIISMMDILPQMHIPHEKLWYAVVVRGLLSVMPGTWYAALDMEQMIREARIDSPDDVASALDLTSSWQVFATADLWIGAAVGIALIAASVRLRRWRDEG